MSKLISWLRKTEMVSQRLAFIFCSEMPASLQLWDDQLDELVERRGEISGGNHKAVRSAAKEPLLEHIRNGGRASARHDVAARDGHIVVEIAQRIVLAAGLCDQHFREALRAV